MCNHEHLRTVGHRLFCKDCGAELPLEFLTQPKDKPVKRNPKPRKKEPIGFK